MKRFLPFLPFLLLLASNVAPGQIDNYDDVILIVNTRSSNSVEIGNYFASRRAIPDAHICRIAVDTSETIDSARFVAIKWEIQSWMRERNLVDSINYIVTTKGCPLRVSGSWDNTAEQLFGSQSSFEDCLALINGADSMAILAVKSRSLFTSRYFNSRARFRRDPLTMPMYLVTRLDAYTVEQIKSYIVRAETPALAGEGEWVIDLDPGRDGGSYQVYNDYMREGARILTSRGMNVFLNTDNEYLHNRDSVIGYASWGSNDGNSGGGTAAIPGNTWLNGSIAESAVSTSGRSFTTGTGYGQSLVADWIAEGANAVKGYTDEPYLFSIAHPDILFDRYASGFNMAESYYAASQLIGWRQVVIGDPKMKLAVLMAFPGATKSMGQTGRYSTTMDTVWVRNTSSTPIEMIGVRFSGPDSLDFSAAPLVGTFPKTIQGLDSIAIVISYRPTSYGAGNAVIAAIYRRLGETSTGIINMTLTGVGQKPVLTAPPALGFGLSSGETITRSLPLTNQSFTDTIFITRFHYLGADSVEFAITPTPELPFRLLPGETRNIDIVHTPSGAEGAAVRLYVVSNAVTASLRIDLDATGAAGVELGARSRNGEGGSISSITPNPLTGSGRIEYVVAHNAGRVTLELFDLFGRRITTLVDEPRPAGLYTVPLEVATLPSGTYHCRLTIQGATSGTSVSATSVVVTR